MVCLYVPYSSRPYSFKFFKGCLPQNLLSPLLNTLSHIIPNIPICQRSTVPFSNWKQVLCSEGNTQTKTMVNNKMVSYYSLTYSLIYSLIYSLFFNHYGNNKLLIKSFNTIISFFFHNKYCLQCFQLLHLAVLWRSFSVVT